MSNITVTSSGNFVVVDFGDYTGTLVPFERASYRENNIVKIHEYPDHVVVWEIDGKAWKVIHPAGDTTKGAIIDTVDGVAPTSIADLHDKLKAIL